MYRIYFHVIFTLFVLSTPFFVRQAKSHPHVFITNRCTLVFDEKGLAGIRVNWHFDEYFSTMISGDYDTDKNGVIDQDENRKVMKSLESDYPQPQAGAFSPIHGFATAIS